MSNLSRKNVMFRLQTFQTLPNKYEIRRSLITQSNNNNIIQNLSLGPVQNSFNYSNIKNNNTNINDIFKQILEETKTSYKSVDSFKSIKLLELYIRKNRYNIDLIVEKIKDKENPLDENVLMYIIELVLNLITENSKTIYFLQNIIPFLIHKLSKNIDINSITKINSTLKRLIKIGGNNTRKIVEDNLEQLINKFMTENKGFKYESNKFAYIQFFSVVLKSAPAIFYSNFIQNNIKNFLKILDNFKSSKQEIRIIIGKIMIQFISMVTYREKEMRNNYPSIIYIHAYSQYEKHLKENNDIPNNINLFSGLCTILIAIYLAYPAFYKNQYLYTTLVSNIFKAKNSRNNLIKIEFINFVPDMYKMNKEIFTEKYLNTKKRCLYILLAILKKFFLERGLTGNEKFIFIVKNN